MPAIPEVAARSTEIELKLVGRRNVLEAVFADLGAVAAANGANAANGRAAVPAAKTSTVTSVYFDTVDRRLWRKGLTLRLRRKGRKHELTLKREAAELARGEWSSLLDTAIVDTGLLPPDAPRDEIGLVLPEELSERFRTVIERTKKVVTVEGMELEVSLDRGEVIAGDRRMPIEELEIELLSGDPRGLAPLARRIVSRRRVALAFGSKASRGILLADNEAPRWVKAKRPELRPDDTVGTALARIVELSARQIAANMGPSADGRDPEGVHQLRVGLRRLRSALSLFGKQAPGLPATLAADAKVALAGLGPARDLDVFLTETLPPVMAAHEAPRPLRLLMEIAENRQAKAHEDVRRLLRDRPLSRLLLDLHILSADGCPGSAATVLQDPDRSLRPVAADLLARRHRKVLKAGRDFRTMATQERHTVRLALKKLRYAVDFFVALFPGAAATAYLKHLEQLQDDLGRLNDATVAAILVDDLAAADPEARIGAALVKGWYGHRLDSVEPDMLKAWEQFRAAEPFWVAAADPRTDSGKKGGKAKAVARKAAVGKAADGKASSVKAGKDKRRKAGKDRKK